MRPVAAALAALSALLIAPLGSSTPTPNVVGVLIRPPVPTCSEGFPCDPAPRASALVFTSRSRIVAGIHVGTGGRFATHLAPGRYNVRALPILTTQKLTPATIVVPARGVLRLRLVIR